MVKFVKVTEFRYGMPDTVAWILEHKMWAWEILDKDDRLIGWLYCNMLSDQIAFVHFEVERSADMKRVLALEFRSAYEKAMRMLSPIFSAIYFNVRLKDSDLLFFLRKRGCLDVDQYSYFGEFWVVLKYFEKKNAILNSDEEPETTVNFLTGEENDGNESVNSGTTGRSGSDSDRQRGHNSGNAGCEASSTKAPGAELRTAADDSCRKQQPKQRK